MSRSFVKLERLVCDLERFALMPASDISAGDALDILADLSKTLPAARGEASKSSRTERSWPKRKKIRRVK